ncbi:TonB-dependent receptor [Pseudohaliea rubra DSM 19751]|uniref:TonB-dependent receptor n=2 Tax=Pseudohaliea TaxID=1341120 RepID=A0A095VST4_9GAMM|nr:TonB-dependent receptor [Pseudohaliea rubra DSM 19751]
MFKKHSLTAAVSAALGVSAVIGMPGTVLAQQEQLMEEVIVTGSRITRGPETISNMSMTSGEDIERLGTYSTLDALQRMPAVTNSGGATNRNNSNGGRGANFVEIHNLGSERTLVLMDGRRAVSTIRDSSGLGVDLQSFPVNMIERVEVLADGASTIYGSDAVAGVVNVILKDDFEGFEFTAGTGSPEDAGGESQNVGFLLGSGSARSHFVLSGTYTETENVDFQDREWSQIPLLGQSDDGSGSILNLIGSGIPPEGRVPAAGIIFKEDPVTGASFQPYDTFGFSGLNGSAGDGSIQSILDTGHRFNYNAPGGDGVSLINPARIFNLAAIGEVELNNSWTAYSNILAQHREGTLNFTPLPVAGAAGRFTDLIQVPIDHPNLPADARAEIQGALGPDAESFQLWYRGLDLGNRKFKYDADTMQGTFGFRGELDIAGSTWDVDTWGTWGQSRLTEVTFGQLNVGALQIASDPARCAVIDNCPKKANGDPLFDPFGRSPKTQAEKDFILFEDHEKTEYEMWHFAATISNPSVVDLPAGGLGIAAGVEYREESGSVTPSGIVGDGNSGGNFAEPTDGEYDLYEVYVESEIPLISGAPFAEEVSAQLAARFSDYGDFDETTWKVGARWQPLQSLTFRGQLSTGFRAPNVLELFGGNADAFTGVTDPCNSENQAANPTVAANCAAEGVPSDFVQPAAQLKITQGGNPDLQPETSDNMSVGFVFTPEVWGSPSISLDYYDVEIDDAIGTPVESTVINTCYESQGLSAPECDRIARGPGGDVVRFDLLLENLSTIETSGIDLNSSFTWNTDFGMVSADWLLMWLEDYKEVSATGVVEDQRGKVACTTCSFAGYPEYKSTLSLSLAQDSWSTSLVWRYLDAMDISDEVGFDNVNTEVDEMNYFDFYASYNFSAFEVSVAVENLTDEQPPFVPAISTNTSAIYDFLGRFYSARLVWRM